MKASNSNTNNNINNINNTYSQSLELADLLYFISKIKDNNKLYESLIFSLGLDSCYNTINFLTLKENPYLYSNIAFYCQTHGKFINEMYIELLDLFTNYIYNNELVNKENTNNNSVKDEFNELLEDRFLNANKQIKNINTNNQVNSTELSHLMPNEKKIYDGITKYVKNNFGEDIEISKEFEGIEDLIKMESDNKEINYQSPNNFTKMRSKYKSCSKNAKLANSSNNEEENIKSINVNLENENSKDLNENLDSRVNQITSPYRFNEFFSFAKELNQENPACCKVETKENLNKIVKSESKSLLNSNITSEVSKNDKEFEQTNIVKPDLNNNSFYNNENFLSSNIIYPCDPKFESLNYMSTTPIKSRSNSPNYDLNLCHDQSCLSQDYACLKPDFLDDNELLSKIHHYEYENLNIPKSNSNHTHSKSAEKLIKNDKSNSGNEVLGVNNSLNLVTEKDKDQKTLSSLNFFARNSNNSQTNNTKPIGLSSDLDLETNNSKEKESSNSSISNSVNNLSNLQTKNIRTVTTNCLSFERKEQNFSSSKLHKCSGDCMTFGADNSEGVKSQKTLEAENSQFPINAFKFEERPKIRYYDSVYNESFSLNHDRPTTTVKEAFIKFKSLVIKDREQYKLNKESVITISDIENYQDFFAYFFKNYKKSINDDFKNVINQDELEKYIQSLSKTEDDSTQK